MQNQAADLNQMLSSLLIETYSDNLSFEKLFKRLSSIAFTNELSASLSPDRNELNQQAGRLQTIITELKIRPVKTTAEVGEAYIKVGRAMYSAKKKPTLQQDVNILTLVKDITYRRLAQTNTLESMARVLGMESFVMLLEQSGLECRNAAAYLGQIENNILYPAFLTSESKSTT